MKRATASRTRCSRSAPAATAQVRLISRRVIRPSEAEVAQNCRASARLRVAEPLAPASGRRQRVGHMSRGRTRHQGSRRRAYSARQRKSVNAACAPCARTRALSDGPAAVEQDAIPTSRHRPGPCVCRAARQPPERSRNVMAAIGARPAGVLGDIDWGLRRPLRKPGRGSRSGLPSAAGIVRRRRAAGLLWRWSSSWCRPCWPCCT